MKDGQNIVENDRELVRFQKKFDLSDEQTNKFHIYSSLLRQWNRKINLTSIIASQDIITRHFEDSILVGRYIDINKFSMLADVGTGAGFPVLPLKILYPKMSAVLIEVVGKKITFLQEVIDKLELSDVVISDLDWRTFLRKTSYPIDLFCARASITVEELIRMFKPSSPYRHSQLIYWAARTWRVSSCAKPFLDRQESYEIDNKKRSYVIFRSKNNK